VPKVNNRPIGEKSLNLVTLLVILIKKSDVMYLVRFAVKSEADGLAEDDGQSHKSQRDKREGDQPDDPRSPAALHRTIFGAKFVACNFLGETFLQIFGRNRLLSGETNFWL
jgi:hypothetical protein